MSFLYLSSFIPRYNISVDEERQLALKRLQAMCSQGFFSVRDFLTNPDKIFAAHEVAGLIDGSMATKMTVQVRKRKRAMKIERLSLFNDTTENSSILLWSLQIHALI